MAANYKQARKLVTWHWQWIVLNEFLPVPIDGLTAEFAAGDTPEDICARTIRALIDVGARHFYISNLPLARAQTVLGTILEKAGVKT